MKSKNLCLSVFALALFPMSATAQSPVGDRIIYPPEFSPLIRSRPRPEQRPLVPATKFVKKQNAIPNRYIVVLIDDTVASDAPLDVRRERITAVANSLAEAHLGKVGSVWETALKGFSVDLPDESAAIALSENSQVKWVEEEGWLSLGVVVPEPPKVPAPSCRRLLCLREHIQRENGITLDNTEF